MRIETLALERSRQAITNFGQQLVLSYVRQHCSVRRGDAAELCRLSPVQARDLLKRLKQSGQLVQHGERRGAYCVLRQSGPN